MIKLIATDIDGTLVEDGGNALDPQLFPVILELRKRGIQFAAASGRQWGSIESLFEPVKEKLFYLSDNGAYVGCHGRNLFTNPIDRGTVMELVEDVRRLPNMEVMVSGPDVIYVETRDSHFLDWMVNGYRFRIRQVGDLARVEDSFIKVSVYRKTSVEEGTKGLREKYGSRLKMTVAGDMWLDCMKLGVSKGQAIGLLQESLGISERETMAFGDQSNDIEMLGKAYYSFAIGNARAEVKKAARFQADTNQRGGVLKVLKSLL